MEFVSSLLGLKGTDQSGLFTQEELLKRKVIVIQDTVTSGKKLQQYD